jgi:rfaE bifunctional protein kinase chain/domain
MTEKYKTVLVSGNFNVVHPGHLRLFRFAKEYGEKLIVAVNSDLNSNGASMVIQDLRLDGVKSIGMVDDAFILNGCIAKLIDKLKPDVVVKGKEYEGIFNIEAQALNQYGGKLIFTSGDSIFSSIDFLRSEMLDNILSFDKYPKDYLIRHNLEDRSEILQVIEKFASIKVCVVGDLIIDEYVTCNPLGMSQEDPTIVVTPICSSKFLGGAAIVAAHAAQLGADVSCITVAGGDGGHVFAEDKLSEYGVQSQIIIDDTRPTTLKQRYRSKGKTLLRVSHLHQSSISSDLQARFYREVERQLEHCDLLIFSDFNYGCLPQELVQKIIDHAKTLKIMMAADSQSSSQIGDISRFYGMDLITPTEREARLSTMDHSSGLAVLAEKIRELSSAKNVILKMGEDGALIHTHTKYKETTWQTDQIEALNRSPKDVAGAGDSMLITASLSLASGASIWLATYLASIAAAIQIGRVGNLPISAKELISKV